MRTFRTEASVSLCLSLALGAAALQQAGPPGYRDTPNLPGSRWRVHDADRPRPRAVQPGQGSLPPSDAVVLFDGSSLEAWKSADGAAQWRLVDGAMEVNGTGDIETKEAFGDVQLHLEWMTPDEPKAQSQGKGNSGVFLMGRYEVQILDSHANDTYADGQAAALYGQYPPDVNASRPSGEWQSYDICFVAPRFEGDRLLEPARITVMHNGVLVHHARELVGATVHRDVARYVPHPDQLPLRLQDHGNPVRYRNCWLRRL
jgi:hypothetical protein